MCGSIIRDDPRSNFIFFPPVSENHFTSDSGWRPRNRTYIKAEVSMVRAYAHVMPKLKSMLRVYGCDVLLSKVSRRQLEIFQQVLFDEAPSRIVRPCPDTLGPSRTDPDRHKPCKAQPGKNSKDVR